MDAQAVDVAGYREMALASGKRAVDLKRLSFVHSYSAHYTSKVAAMYKGSRTRVPGALLPGLEALEGCMSSLSLPMVHAMQLRSEQLLTSLDRKVCLHASHWSMRGLLGS